MIKSSKEKSFARQFRKYLLSIISVIIFLVGAALIYTQYEKANREIERYEQQTYTEKKRLLNNEVHEAITFIENEQRDIQQRMLQKLKKRVNEAHSQAMHLYEKYNGRVSDERLKKIIIESLRPQRFFNGRGYYFIVNLEGKELLYPVRPEMEGKNLLDLTDERGNKVIKQEINTVKNNDQGYVEAYWPAPDMPDTSAYKKTSFVKKFAPFNWYIGTGEYKISMVQEAKQKALNRLSEIRYGKGRYIFVNTYDGKALLIHSNKYDKGDNISDITDPNGVKIFEKELKAAQNPDGGFVRYEWYEPKDYQYVKNLSYVNGYDEWEWIIGAWTDIDMIEEEIASQKEQIRQETFTRIIVLLIIIAVIILVIYLIAGRLGKVINNSFQHFTDQLDNAMRSSSFIDDGSFKFREFKKLSNSTNKIISERNKATKKLSQSEYELKTIFQSAPIMIAGINPDGSFEVYNDYVETTLGYTAEELKDFENAVKLLMKDSDERQKALNNFRQKPGNFTEYRLITKNGSERIQYWASFSLFQDKTIIFGYDLTELKKTQAKLQEREKELKKLNATKDRFFSIIAHDLKNPLNALNGFASLLKEEYDEYDEEERKEIVQNIIISTENMSKLLQNLLEWSRSQMGRLSFNPEPFHPDEVINENISLLNTQAEKKKINLSYQKSGYIQEVYADKKMISTVIRNLVSNAIKFTYPNGSVTVRATQQKGHCRIKVEDTGTGMTEEEKEKIFNLGEKFNKTGTSNEKGTGLGLMLAQEFIEKNKGTLQLSSEPDKGSTFWFTLPSGESNE